MLRKITLMYFCTLICTTTYSFNDYEKRIIKKHKLTQENNLPIAVEDAVTVFSNSSANEIDVLDNDDPGLDGYIDGGLTMRNGTLNSASSQGGVIFIDNKGTGDTTDDVFNYVPPVNFIGNDTFEYVITDSNGDASIGLVKVEVVEEIFNVPTATNDTQILEQNSSDNSLEVLLNDAFGSEGRATENYLTIVVPSITNGATITVDGDNIIYTPATGFSGNDSFNYTITDGIAQTATATVNVTVAPEEFVNDVPTAVNDAITITQNSIRAVIDILPNDSFGNEGPATNHDPVTTNKGWMMQTTEMGALFCINENNDNSPYGAFYITYTPAANFTGTDTFEYVITDANGDASTGVVTVTVEEDPTLLTLIDDTAEVDENSSDNEINIYDNDIIGSRVLLRRLIVPSLSTTQGGTLVVKNNFSRLPLDYTIEYTPAADFTGEDTFQYSLEDTNGVSDPATVTITVKAGEVVNGTPTAVDDSVSVFSNSLATEIDVLDNDSAGSDGYINGGLTMRNGTLNSVSSEGGTIFIDNKGTDNTADDVFNYVPQTNFTGEDTFEYVITDASGDASVGIVTVTVSVEILNVPTASNDTVILEQDSSDNSLEVLANDAFGSEGQSLTDYLIVLVPSIINGATITVDGDNIIYTPAAGFSGNDSFNYTITDGIAQTATATVNITVTAVEFVNDVPTAVNDAISIPQNSIRAVIDVLPNDSFGNEGPTTKHDPLTTNKGWMMQTTEMGALFCINENNDNSPYGAYYITYTPVAGFIGTDTFEYVITDANGDASTGIVTVTVELIEDIPAATADIASVNQDSSVSIDVLDNDDYGTDGASTTVAALTVVANSELGGTLSIVNNEVLYTPAASFVGVDTFEYTITDDSGDTSSATVTITVNEISIVNGLPTAVEDDVTVFSGSSANEIDVLDNDDSGSDGYIDGGLTMRNGTLNSASSEGGLISIDNKGTEDTSDDVFNYIPPANFTGNDTFEYVITDTSGDASVGLVKVEVVVEVLAVPTAREDTATVDQDSSVSIDVLDNDDYGTDGASTTVAVLTVVANSDLGGTLSIVNDEVLYTPAASFVGVDTFEYTITDDSGDTSSATVTVTVLSVVQINGTPTAIDDNVTVSRNASTPNAIIYFDVTANDDFGSDGQNANHPLVLINGKMDTASNGGRRIKIDDNGTENDPSDDRIAYYSTNNESFISDSFVYTITDANGDASTATVYVTLSDVASKSENSTSLFDNSFSAYPNPSNGYVKTSIKSLEATNANVYLFDITGKVIYNKKVELNKGLNLLEFNFNVKAGVMFLKIFTSDINLGTQKIIFRK